MVTAVLLLLLLHGQDEKGRCSLHNPEAAGGPLLPAMLKMRDFRRWNFLTNPRYLPSHMGSSRILLAEIRGLAVVVKLSELSALLLGKQGGSRAQAAHRVPDCQLPDTRLLLRCRAYVGVSWMAVPSPQLPLSASDYNRLFVLTSQGTSGAINVA